MVSLRLTTLLVLVNFLSGFGQFITGGSLVGSYLKAKVAKHVKRGVKRAVLGAAGDAISSRVNMSDAAEGDDICCMCKKIESSNSRLRSKIVIFSAGKYNFDKTHQSKCMDECERKCGEADAVVYNLRLNPSLYRADESDHDGIAQGCMPEHVLANVKQLIPSNPLFEIKEDGSARNFC